MFNFRKKKVSPQEMASGMYILFVRDAVKEPIKDADGNVIFDKKEQRLLMLFHVCSLLDTRGLADVKHLLISVFVKDNRSIKNEVDFACEMLVVMDSVKKLKDAFDRMLLTDDHRFFGKDFQRNPLQDFLALNWYVEKTKAIDSVFKSALNKFRLTADV